MSWWEVGSERVEFDGAIESPSDRLSGFGSMCAGRLVSCWQMVIELMCILESNAMQVSRSVSVSLRFEFVTFFGRDIGSNTFIGKCYVMVTAEMFCYRMIKNDGSKELLCDRALACFLAFSS